jgi:hypothetical protein
MVVDILLNRILKAERSVCPKTPTIRQSELYGTKVVVLLPITASMADKDVNDAGKTVALLPPAPVIRPDINI